MGKRRRKAVVKKNNTWVIVSGILAVALLVSVMTGGFRFNDGIGYCIADLQKAISTTDNAELKTSLQGIMEDLKLAEQKLQAVPAEPAGENKDKAAGAATPASAGETAVFEMYVMSQCPYGTQVMDKIAPVKEKLGDALDLRIDYITYPESQYKGRESQFCIDGMCSMHGTNEVKGDIVELCAKKHSPERYLDLITCMDKNARSIPDNWEGCAKDLGLSTDKIKTCSEGEEGKQLLRESSGRAAARKATASPTLYLEGAKYSGGRTSDDFLRAICNQFEDRPEACRDLPEPVSVEVTVLNDKACANCDTANIVSITRQLFPGAKIRNVDVSSDEGKKLVEEYGIILAPAYLFSADVTKTATWKERGASLAGAFDKIGDRYKLKDSQTGASHYIDEEKRKEVQAKMGITTGDNKPQIDFFVMSYCPYGNIAEEAIYEVYKNLGDTVEFKPHYVIYSNYQGGGPKFCMDEESKFCSMHGIQEVNQDIREECVRREYGIEAWFQFAEAMNKRCNSKNADTCWTDVASELGYDTDKISACEKEQGLEIMAENKELDELFGARGSPAVYIDGVEFKGERSPAGYQKGLCSAFDDAPDACKEALSADTGNAPAGSCG